MRKASQDGGDSTSITSGIENETKKPGAGILKSTKNSIKRKVQHFSDDTANEPLLHKNKELSEIEKQSAKLLLTKTKTDFGCQKSDDKDKLLADDKIAKPSISDVAGITHHGVIIVLSKNLKEQQHPNAQSTSTASIHNHMNTNVFGNMEGLKNSAVAKTQILVELDASKPTGYSPSPLIFTTAKIHTDGKMQQMEPVQVTPVPILSTIEGGVVKTETKTKDSSEKPKGGEFIEINNKKVTEPQSEKIKNIIETPLTTQASLSNVSNKHEFNATSTQKTIGNKPAQKLISDNNEKDASKLKHISTDLGNVKNTPAQLPDINKKNNDEIFSTKIPQLLQGNNGSTGSKFSNNTSKPTESTKFSKNIPVLNKTEEHKISSTSSTVDKNCVDINKNIQSGSQLDPESRNAGNNKVDLKNETYKTITDTNKIQEIGVGSGIKELSKLNPSPISTGKPSKEDQKAKDIKSPSNQAQHNVKSFSSEKSAVTTTATANNTIKTMESSLSKASLPSTSFSSTKKFSAIDKPPSTLSSKKISTESSPIMRPSSKNSVTSEKSNVTKTFSVTTSILTNTTSEIPQIASSSPLTQYKIISTTVSSKISPSDPVSNVPNISQMESKITSSQINTGSNFGSANNQNTTLMNAMKCKSTENVIIKTSTTTTQNNAATVVSSIAKTTTTACGIKLPSSSISSTVAVKSELKQSVSVKTVPSGISTVSSSVKPSTTNAVTSDKISATSNPINKSISNNTKPVSSTTKVSATDNSSIISSALSSTAKPPSASSTKTAVKNVPQSQDKASEAHSHRR